MEHLLAIDPGRSKCGLVLCDLRRGVVIDGRVVPAAEVMACLQAWHSQTPVARVVLGNGTSSRHWHGQLSSWLEVIPVDETGTTLRARERYWELWPPRGWRRCLPRGLRVPPIDLDAVAALVLLEDHLGQRLHWPGPPPGPQKRARTVKV